MTFDTRDKKPKLYSLALISALFALCIIGVCFIQRDIPAKLTFSLCILITAYLIITLAILIITFIKQLQYNPYSYNTILYSGFALFVVSLLATFIIMDINVARDPETYSVAHMAFSLMGAAKTYVILSGPFILIFAVALCVSNISLIRHEGFRKNNIYGIAISLILVAGWLILFFADYAASGSMEEVRTHDMIVNLYAAIYLYLECMLIGTIIGDAIAAAHEPARNKDFVIILGCRPRKDGTPTPLLAGRIDRAIAFYHKQIDETGKKLVFVPSGGQGNAEIMPESTSMRNYLVSKGIPEEQIMEEDQSKNTFENMKFSKEKILAVKPDAKVAFSTTNYHVFRSGVYARRVKMRAEGMGARTKWYFWPNAAVREFVGLLSRHRIKQLIVLGSMIAVFVLLTYFGYEV